MLQMLPQPICQPAKTVPMLSQCKCRNKASDGKIHCPYKAKLSGIFPFSFVGIPQTLEACASIGLVLTNVMQHSSLLPY